MLMPRKPPKGFRKPHHPDRHGAAKGGTRVAFGEFGVQALESAYLTNRQIEAARIAMTRHIRRGGKVWITVFPDQAITKKPAETRMGSGKGSPEGWVANIKPGSWTTTGDCRWSARTSPGSTPSCVSASWACRPLRKR